MAITDWQELVVWMHSPEVEEAKARYTDEPEAEPDEPQQAVLWEVSSER
jgi:hypothetical protein